MKKVRIKKRYLTFFLIFSAVIIGLFSSEILTQNNKTTEAGKSRASELELPIIELQEMFYNEENFLEAVTKASQAKVQNDISAIIVPHHLVPSEYIAELIKRASGRDIEKVIIVGPNHFNIGTNKIATVKAEWFTPNGYIRTDDDLADQLIQDFGVEPDVEVFRMEHSIGAILPFVKYYLGDVKIVPIVFDSYSEIDEADKVASWISHNYDEKTLVIFSIDFSHYLPKEEADKSDVLTRNLIEDRNIKEIMELDNDYVDSPASLAASLILAEKLDLKTDIIYNSNLFNFSNIKPIETTSYFAVAFTQ